MPPQPAHDEPPPPGWPDQVTYLNKPRLSPTFPPILLQYLYPTEAKSPETVPLNFKPRSTSFPSFLQIKKITQPSHPAFGQNGLFTKKKLGPNEFILPYLGVIHASLTPSADHPDLPIIPDPHSESDYDLSLIRISAYDKENPMVGYHVSIGIDASKQGNAGRFVNDYRGVREAGPNAEFRVGVGKGGEMRMEIWTTGTAGKGAKSGTGGIGRGEEIVVSYGKGWWGARKDG